jgi:NAD(P)-dependent dehydrogenase (short-subunit alcohol dehydrogenase family)
LPTVVAGNFAINVRAVFVAVQAAAKHMKASGRFL